MKEFGFVILGAGAIASQFCDAVADIEGARVIAVASKSIKRAKDIAERKDIKSYYDSYADLLDAEKPDCAYVAVTPNDHYRLTMMCIERNIPVLCEKAMFMNGDEADKVFRLAKEKNVFVMEALWSRFLPAVRKVKQWVKEDAVGSTELVQFSIGFIAPKDNNNRYYNPDLGGGTAYDITVYAYQITTYIIEEKIKELTAEATWSESGVDVNDYVTIRFEHTLANLMASFVSRMDECMVIYGAEGKIVLPCPHFSSECYLYDNSGNLKEHFIDNTTKNGFVYEIQEAMECIKSGKYESDIVPHQDTFNCAKMFEKIYQSKERVV